MKKLFVLLAILVFFSGEAFAGSLNEGLTSEVYAQPVGRNTNYDICEMIHVWYDGDEVTYVPQVCVTGSSTTLTQIEFYENGAVGASLGSGIGVFGVNTLFSTGDTIGEAVDIINADPDGRFRAAVGPDAYRSMTITGLLTKAVTSGSLTGTNENNPVKLFDDTSLTNRISAGVKAKAGVVNRLKYIEDGVEGVSNIKSIHQLSIYNGDTCVYQKLWTGKALRALTTNTPLSVNFSSISSKGLASSPGNSLVAVSTYESGMDGQTANSTSFSIIYDQFTQ